MDPGTTRIRRGAFTEVFVASRLEPSVPVGDAARELHGAFLRLVRDEGLMVLQEKVFGPASARDAVLAARREIYAAAGTTPPHDCSYVYGREDDDLGGLTGGLLWGVIADDGATTVDDAVTVQGGAPARLLRSAGVELLYAPSISGGAGLAGDAHDLTAQASQMFHGAADLLAANGFAYRDVARTWIYLRRILDWYDAFNTVRTGFHQAQGIESRGAEQLPASTGVQGAVDAAECVMDVLAVRSSNGTGARLRPLSGSTRQGRAMAYGSGFSRGMVMELGGRRTIWVSGTASIDAEGRSLHVGSRDAQIVETLLNVAALVAPEGAGLRDVCAGTLYCKDRETYAAYREVTRLLGLEDLPLIPVLADICREELLVEIEAVVAVPGRESG